MRLAGHETHANPREIEREREVLHTFNSTFNSAMWTGRLVDGQLIHPLSTPHSFPYLLTYLQSKCPSAVTVRQWSAAPWTQMFIVDFISKYTNLYTVTVSSSFNYSLSFKVKGYYLTSLSAEIGDILVGCR